MAGCNLCIQPFSSNNRNPNSHFSDLGKNLNILAESATMCFGLCFELKGILYPFLGDYRNEHFRQDYWNTQ